MSAGQGERRPTRTGSVRAVHGSPSPGATADRPKLITRPALAAAGRPRVTVVAWLVLLATGIYAFVFALDREGFPPVNVPIAVASANWFVDDELRVDEELAIPVFEAFSGVPGVEGVSTFSRPDGFAAVFEFETTFSSRDGIAALRAATPPSLPDGVELAIDPVDATKFLENYDLIVTVIGPSDATPEELEAQAEITAEALRPLPTVTDAEALDLLTESFDPSTGEIEIRRTDFTRYAEQGDTAGTESVLIGITRNLGADADVLDFSDEIQARLDQGIDGLDPAYRAVIGADFASDVRAQLSNLTSNLLFGLLAVAIVSYLLIGWRTAVVTAVFMATVMLVSMIGLWAIGYTLNTITFFGLVLTLGLLVDDAIVISESIDANRGTDPAEGGASLSIVQRAIDRVGAASFAGTLSTLTVFAPMAFVTGILGEFIRPIPITVMVTLALSFVLSITVIPALGRIFILGGTAQGPLVGLQRAVSSALGRLARYQSGNGPKGWLTGAGVTIAAVGLIIMGAGAAGRIGARAPGWWGRPGCGGGEKTKGRDGGSPGGGRVRGRPRVRRDAAGRRLQEGGARHGLLPRRRATPGTRWGRRAQGARRAARSSPQKTGEDVRSRVLATSRTGGGWRRGPGTTRRGSGTRPRAKSSPRSRRTEMGSKAWLGRRV